MKYLFKTLLICSLSCLFFINASLGREIILIENQATHEEGKLLVRILEEKFNIPRKLISYKRISGTCRKTSEAIMQLCLKSNGEMDVMKVDRFVIENSMGIFLEMGE